MSFKFPRWSKGKGKGGKGKGGRITSWDNQARAGNHKVVRPQKSQLPKEEERELEQRFGIGVVRDGFSRVGYLFNVQAGSVFCEEKGCDLAALFLYFVGRDGSSFRACLPFQPYFFLDVHQSFDQDLVQVSEAVTKRLQGEGGAPINHVEVTLEKRDDLSTLDHLSGKRKTLVKLTCANSDVLRDARRAFQSLIELNTSHGRLKGFSSKNGEGLVLGPAAVDGGAAFLEGPADPLDFLSDIFEHDVSYVTRACIDLNIRCSKWYRVERFENPADLSRLGWTLTLQDMEWTKKPDLRVFAWDIETSKAPLKFPDAEVDQVMMISVLCDGGEGFLLVNREIVKGEIEDFEYTPKPEFKGVFKATNSRNEREMLREFLRLIHSLSPHIMTTFNGDFFDFPFIAKRCEILGLSLSDYGLYEIAEGGASYFAGKWILHIDCFPWVQRDSYLPVGSQGLKAVTRAKLKYEPVELDPENMTPFAEHRPNELAAYSCSDAVATYYLYKKYIHDFIQALCTIIPLNGNDVLRKGSGTLCELLLMAQAFQAEVLFPNKHSDPKLQYYNNHLVETSTYEGGRVECLRTGVFRSDFKEKFHLDTGAIDVLLGDLTETVDYFLMKEAGGLTPSDVENYDEVLEEIRSSLVTLKQNPVREEEPLIYHLDVGAMYPNIILSNRLQPTALVSNDFCAACTWNDPSNDCQRPMEWKWRGDVYMATKSDVRQLERELAVPGHRYPTKDNSTLPEGRPEKVPWLGLSDRERHATLIQNVRMFSQKVHRRVKKSIFEMRSDIVCQRENPFYINTVRAFRDRRYEFKGKVKQWTKRKASAEEKGDPQAIEEAKDMVLLYDSLQLAHKCILNSFYGYVMRKGARWYCMEMAGIVTYTGSSLIKEARSFVDKLGLPLELDTDGIWCMLPRSFPENFELRVKGGGKRVMPYPCCVLNLQVWQKYTNHQYQTEKHLMIGQEGYQDQGAAQQFAWDKHSENSIFFEIDGPYKAMLLPASTDEDKMLKKRYAVFEHDGSIAELKGFEIKRRGELKLIQVFQEEVFPAFLKGRSKAEVYSLVGEVANRWLEVCERQGETLTDEEVINLISEKKSMSKSVEESGNLKSTSITTARRMSEFLNLPGLTTEKGISCHLVIAKKPEDAKPTDRAIPVNIFSAPLDVKKKFLRRWLGDPGLSDFDIRSVIDWEYYKTRLGSAVQKIIVIPALNQRCPNPCPSVVLPKWMERKVRVWTDKRKQMDMKAFVSYKNAREPEKTLNVDEKADIENLPPQLEGKKLRLGLEEAKESKCPPLFTSSWLQWQKKKWGALKKKNFSQSFQGASSRKGKLSIFEELAAASGDLQFQPTAPGEPLPPTSDAPVLASPGSEDEEVEEEGNDARRVDLKTVGPEPGFPAPAPAMAGVGKLKFSWALKKLSIAPWHILGIEGPDKWASRQSRMSERGNYALWITTAEARQMFKVKVWRGPGKDWSYPGSNGFLPVLIRYLMGEDQCEKAVSDAIQKCALVMNAEVQHVSVLPPSSSTTSGISLPRCQSLPPSCSASWVSLDTSVFEKAVLSRESDLLTSEWVDGIYETQVSSDFEMSVTLSSVCEVKQHESLEDAFYETLCLSDSRKLQANRSESYVPPASTAESVLSSSSAAFLPIFLFIRKNSPKSSRVSCCLFCPRMNKFLYSVSGVPSHHQVPSALGGKRVRHALAVSLLGKQDGEVDSHAVEDKERELQEEAQVEFVQCDSVSELAGLLDRKLQEWVSKLKVAVGVLASDSPLDEIRGFKKSASPSLSLPSSRKLPLCEFPLKMEKFAGINWEWENLDKFLNLKVKVEEWWSSKVSLARVSRVPLCSLPVSDPHIFALDALYARRLRDKAVALWVGRNGKPDLGSSECVEVTMREDEMEATLESLRSCSTSGEKLLEVSNKGMYRGICMSLNVEAQICLVALLNVARLDEIDGAPLKLPGEADLQPPVGDLGYRPFSALVGLVEYLHQLSQRLAAKLDKSKACGNEGTQTTELELKECQKLLKTLLRWILTPDGGSLLWDPALRAKVVFYISKALNEIIAEIQKAGGSVIYASFHKILFSTGQTRITEATSFWGSLKRAIKANRALSTLDLREEVVLSQMFFGLLWLDVSNWIAIPLSMRGPQKWQCLSQWKLGEYLPSAINSAVKARAMEFLIKPMKLISSLREGEEVEICRGRTVKLSSSPSNTEVMGLLREFIRKSHLPLIRAKLFDQLEKIRGKITESKREAENTRLQLRALEEVDEDEVSVVSDISVASEGSEDLTGKDGRRRRLEKRLENLEDMWRFPQPPGALDTIGDDPALEFAKTIAEILCLESGDPILSDSIHALRKDMLKLLRVGEFSEEAAFENPQEAVGPGNFTVEVCCQCCDSLNEVDPVGSDNLSPGEWPCPGCGQILDRDSFEGKMVEKAQELLAAWQNQNIACKKCRQGRTRPMALFCACYSKFEAQIEVDAPLRVLRSLKSIAIANELEWLREVIEEMEP